MVKKVNVTVEIISWKLPEAATSAKGKNPRQMIQAAFDDARNEIFNPTIEAAVAKAVDKKEKATNKDQTQTELLLLHSWLDAFQMFMHSFPSVFKADVNNGKAGGEGGDDDDIPEDIFSKFRSYVQGDE
ncbi:hypothetical protein N0V86_009435 [Didymella sp. IMI 355093]|nr:hypothetical protein N0V86_009435 [Didymella sp. IMI 355093]